MNWKWLFTVTAFTAGLSVGCATAPAPATASSPSPCAQKDWYEIGRHDGFQGITLDVMGSYRQECPREFRGNLETMYTNGRNAGLVEYCSEENAHELGRAGLAYKYVCPAISEPGFLAAYRKGQSARKLEIENQKLDAEIDALLSQLNNARTDTYQKRQIASELDSLRKERAKKERELDDTQSEN